MPDMPIIDWWLDEAKDILDDRRFGDPIEKAARMFRKTGCRMTLATQYPAIEDLGNRMGLRNQVKIGNVVSYRLGTGVGKTMVLPSWAPNPSEIPLIGQDGEPTAGMNFTMTSAPGGDRPTFQRTVLIEYEHKWAEIAAQRIPEIEKEGQDAMGDDWYKRWERREKAEHAPAVIDLAPAARPTPAVAPTRTAPAKTRDAILQYLADHDGPATSGSVSAALDISRSAATMALTRLKDDGKVTSERRGMSAMGSRSFWRWRRSRRRCVTSRQSPPTMGRAAGSHGRSRSAPSSSRSRGSLSCGARRMRGIGRLSAGRV
jgi:DNA-binding transcriptional ArsR family regulator